MNKARPPHFSSPGAGKSPGSTFPATPQHWDCRHMLASSLVCGFWVLEQRSSGLHSQRAFYCLSHPFHPVDSAASQGAALWRSGPLAGSFTLKTKKANAEDVENKNLRGAIAPQFVHPLVFYKLQTRAYFCLFLYVASHRLGCLSRVWFHFLFFTAHYKV